jgi:hypothetical protein
MSDLSFGKLIVPALLTTGAVFTALSAPVVMFAETPLTINQGKANLYSGPVRDAALPYLMLAGATSVGLGISGVAMAGWRKSSKRAESLSEAIDSQQQLRVEREAHLKATLASESYLAKSGLDFFLEDGELTPFAPEKLAVVQVLPVPAPITRSSIATPIAKPIVAPIDDLAAHLDWLDGGDVVVPVADRPQPPIVRPARPMSVRPPVPTPAPSAAPLTAAQGFYGFSRGHEGQRSAPVPHQVAAQDQMTIARIQSLQTQLQAIVTQIESLQLNLPTTASTIQVVEDVSVAQSGLVQSEFKLPAAPAAMHRDSSVQYARRVAS